MIYDDDDDDDDDEYVLPKSYSRPLIQPWKWYLRKHTSFGHHGNGCHSSGLPNPENAHNMQHI